MILALAEVVPGEQLLQADELRPARGGFADAGDGVFEVGGLIGPDRLLDEADADEARGSHSVTKIVPVISRSPEPILRGRSGQGAQSQAHPSRSLRTGSPEPGARPKPGAQILSSIGWFAALLAAAFPLSAQRIDWRTRAVLYGDNTEFFTPYRVGETILGGQVTTWLADRIGRRSELRIGLFADRRWGSDHFTDSLKPVLAFRYDTPHSLGVFGTLETVQRHGLLEPLMVTTRELTTPIEYGGQWIENRGAFHGEAWINWQKLNTPAQREQFELGTVLRLQPIRRMRAELQQLWYHRGGQLYDPTPLSNNRTLAIGATLSDSLGKLGRSSLAAWQLWSWGHIDPAYPTDRPTKGHGTYVRAGITPWNWAEIFAIHWIGRDYSGDAGDNNYNSTGFDPTFYRSPRVYTPRSA